MKIHIKDVNKSVIAQIISDKILINNTQDALNLMAECDERGARHIILHEKNIAPEFFNLKTGLAGEILQKFVNYQVKLTITGDFTGIKSKAFQDFIRESNTQGHIHFKSDKAEK